MNEQDFKSALQDAMVTSSAPPPMDSMAALETARRAHRRRRAIWSGGIAALAVVGIAFGALVLPTLTGTRAGDLQVAGQGGSSPAVPPMATAPPRVTVTMPPASTSNYAKPPPGGSNTSTSWPDGQTDRTATSGPRADKSVQLLNELSSAVPAGYQAVDKEPIGKDFLGGMRQTQSQFRDYSTVGQVWEYMVTTPLVRTDGSPNVGLLWAQVQTKDGDLPTDPCELTTKAWGIEGTCAVTDIAGKKVGVLTGKPGSEDRFDQLAAFRHEDGTVVFVAQAKAYADSGYPGFDKLPMTVEQLATLATNPKFRLD